MVLVEIHMKDALWRLIPSTQLIIVANKWWFQAQDLHLIHIPQKWAFIFSLGNRIKGPFINMPVEDTLSASCHKTRLGLLDTITAMDFLTQKQILFWVWAPAFAPMKLNGELFWTAKLEKE